MGKDLGRALLGSLSAWLYVVQGGADDSLSTSHHVSDVSVLLGFSCIHLGPQTPGCLGLSGTITLTES